jgi:hypothetical protein
LLILANEPPEILRRFEEVIQTRSEQHFDPSKT